MIYNGNQVGRTRGGRYTSRPIVEMEPDDFPPDSKYWQACARGSAIRFVDLFGKEAYDALIDAQPDGQTWRELHDVVEREIVSRSQDSTEAQAAE